MRHIIQWDNAEKTVVLQQYTDNASKEDMYYLAKKSHDMLLEVEHRVHLIIDEHNINLVLNSADMRYLQYWTPANQGAVVLVGQPVKLSYKRRIHQYGRKVAPDAFKEPYFAESVEEARKFLIQTFDVKYEERTE